LKSIWEKDKENREKQKEMTNRIKEMVKESSMKMILDKYEKQLRVVFKYYIDSVHLSLGKEAPPDTLQFQGFAGFTSDFNIWPGLTSLQEVRLLFNSMTKEVESGVQPSITYEEFLESLMRITIKSKEKLDKIFEIKRKVNEANNNEAKKDAEDELERERERGAKGNEEENQDENQGENNNEVDAYEEIEGTTRNTLEGLLFYLNLPEDKTELLKKLNFLKETRPKAWREKKNCKCFY